MQLCVLRRSHQQRAQHIYTGPVSLFSPGKKIKSRPYLVMYLVSVMAIYRRVIYSIIIIHDQMPVRNPKSEGEVLPSLGRQGGRPPQKMVVYSLSSLLGQNQQVRINTHFLRNEVLSRSICLR